LSAFNKSLSGFANSIFSAQRYYRLSNLVSDLSAIWSLIVSRCLNNKQGINTCRFEIMTGHLKSV